MPRNRYPDVVSIIVVGSCRRDGNIPDDSTNGFAHKLGAMCNKIFAIQ